MDQDREDMIDTLRDTLVKMKPRPDDRMQSLFSQAPSVASQDQFLANVHRLGLGRFCDVVRHAKEENGTWETFLQNEVFFVSKEKGAGGSADTDLNRVSLQDQLSVYKTAWNVEYQGGAAALLEDIALSATSEPACNHPYANQITIIQSSGTGKSRTVDQLAKRLFTFPFNLREVDDNRVDTAYPPPDAIVREYFLTQEGGITERREQAARYSSFFRALFDEARVVFCPDVETVKSAQDLRQRLLIGRRQDFYESVVTRAKSNREKDKGLRPDQVFAITFESLKKLRGSLMPSPGVQEPIVIYFDEANALHNKVLHNDLTSNNGPTSRGDASYYTALCTAIDALSQEGIGAAFGIFLSTKSSLAHFAPPREHHNSNRVTGDGQNPLLAPFTELPFDVHPKFPIGNVTLDELHKVSFMCRFGRPLFWTRYEAASDKNPAKLIKLAETKLICADSMPGVALPERHAAELAVLGVRLLLEFEPVRRAPAQNMEEYLVERNMRIAYSVPQHRYYMRSGYSSEPILAEAAANLMQGLRTTEQTPDEYPEDRIANILRRHVQNGLISRGELGELTGRLLLILAMDSAQEHAQPRKMENIRWSKPVGVIDFVKALFGITNYDKHIRSCVPDNSSGEAFDDVFKNSVVRFTHFARADSDSGVTTSAAHAAFVRGFGIQCHPHQQSADIVIPVLRDKNKPVEEKNMTIILISVKNRIRASNINDTAIDADQLGCFLESDLFGQDGGIRPYISLVMEFGAQRRTASSAAPKNCPPATAGTLKRSTDVESSMSRKKVKTTPYATVSPHSTIDSHLQAVRRSPRIEAKRPVHPRYLIRICGCSPSVYSVVHNKDVYAHILHARPIFSEHARSEKFVAAVRRLKPFFSEGPDGRDHWLKKNADTTENVEGDGTVDAIEVGKAPEEDMEI